MINFEKHDYPRSVFLIASLKGQNKVATILFKHKAFGKVKEGRRKRRWKRT